MKASIIIPTYNRANLLEKTLIALLNQTINMQEIEVLVCDDGSSDNTKEICDKYSKKLNLRYFYQEDNGFRAAAARNIGIKNSTSEICIFIDTGILLSSKAIENHIITHENNTSDSAVIGYVYGFDDYLKYEDKVEELTNVNDIDKSIEKLIEYKVVDSREKLYAELGDEINSWPAPWTIFWTCNVSVKTSVLKRVGMFDEYYNTWGGEDTDLALALNENNIKFVLNRNCDSIDYPHEKLNLYNENPELANKEFERKRDYMNKKYNTVAIKVWYEKRYDELNQELIKRQKDRKSIIWNVTRYCSWNCKICCVNAKYVPGMNQINKQCSEDFSLDNELNLRQKKKVIDSLIPGKFRIDFSGGELNIDPANIELIEYAAEKLGKDNIGISTSGAFLTDEVLERLSKCVSDVELTLDYLPFHGYPIRPVGYHEYAAFAIQKLKAHNISVGIQTVVTSHNKSKEKLFEIYEWAKENKIDTWSLLRFFDSGRGENFSECKVSFNEYKEIVDYVKEMTKNEENMDIQFQYLLPNHDKHTYSCRAVKKSIGILPNGEVISCFWALNKAMKVSDDRFLLGNVTEQTIPEILNGKKSKYWLDNNHMCKIFNSNEGVEVKSEKVAN